MKKILLIALCLATVLLVFGVQSHNYVACPDWDIYVANQNGTPMPGISVHVAAGDPKVEDQYTIDLTTDATGHVFVPQRLVHASRSGGLPFAFSAGAAPFGF